MVDLENHWEKKRDVAMCASLVSSRLLSEIARVEGFYYEDTLTGFKWIGSRAEALRKKGYRVLFCYEEAMGFCCGDVISDKDGISALGVFGELSYYVYMQGLSLSDQLQRLYDKYGEFVSRNGYYFMSDNSVAVAIFNDIRNDGKYLQSVGQYEVESIRDLGMPGYDSNQPDNKPILPTSKISMITIFFVNGCVAHFRTSGTEPKLKYYFELKGRPGVARKDVESDLNRISTEILNYVIKPGEKELLHL